MLNIFIISLITTGIITRLITHKLHDRKNYNKKTLTGYLRNKTKSEIHHIHFGFILLTISLISLYFQINNYSITLLAISLSLIADQIFPLFEVCDYFYKKGILLSISNHIIIIIISIILF
jgi:hypothetical protein